MDRTSDALTAHVAGQSDYYDLDAEAKSKASASSVELFENIISLLPKEEAAQIQERAGHVLEWLGGALFKEVNPKKIVHTDFEKKYSNQWEKFRNKNAIHLELGTWMAWPDERTDQFVRDNELGDCIRLDMNTDFRPDVAASVTSLPFADASIDRISSNSLFEHVAYPHEILREAFRVLRPGGVLYTAVPFHFVQHSCPRDYLRYSGDFFEDVGSDIGFSEIHVDTASTSGLYYTLHTLAKSALVEPSLDPARRRFAQALQVAVIGAVALGIATDDMIVAGGASHWHTTHMFAVKPGTYLPRNEKIDRAQPFLTRHKDLLICPKTGEPLRQSNGELCTADGQNRYPIVNGVPNLFELHGRFSTQALELECKRLRDENRQLLEKLKG